MNYKTRQMMPAPEYLRACYKNNNNIMLDRVYGLVVRVDEEGEETIDPIVLCDSYLDIESEDNTKNYVGLLDIREYLDFDGEIDRYAVNRFFGCKG